MNSCLYTGKVVHARFEPVPHRFDYRVCQLYVDLDELPTLFDPYWLWSARRPAFAHFCRADYAGAPGTPLADAVRGLVAERTGETVHGPIRLLTHPRYFGYVFNPVSFYFCFGSTGQDVEFIVAEIMNTPWGERHSYVLRCSGEGPWRFEFAKGFHVSPFMSMNQAYRWQLSQPGAGLAIEMENVEDGALVFRAGLALRREPIGRASLASALVRFPLMSAKVIGAIYFEALRLRMKGVPFYEHPRRSETTPAISPREGL